MTREYALGAIDERFRAQPTRAAPSTVFVIQDE